MAFGHHDEADHRGWQLCWWLLLFCVVGGGCQRSDTSMPIPRLAATTSYLEAAAYDLLGNETSVLRLAEPGTCPGHFDLRPSQLAALRQCDILLRFDFQSALDDKWRGEKTGQRRAVAVTVGEGKCLPDHYLSACRQVADALLACHWLAPAAAAARLQSITNRLNALASDLTNRVIQAGLAGKAVVASVRQSEFCAWLGLNVAAVFHPADTARVRAIDEAIQAADQAGVTLVIANLPEGRRAADALAERLQARVILFGNFPVMQNGRLSFDDLLVANVEALLQAAKP